MPQSSIESEVQRFMKGLQRRNPHETEFHQAVEEVVRSVMPFILEHSAYRKAKILERMTEPDRIVTFRVTWLDCEGNFRVNRAWRVQFNNAIGPYKGGMRFTKNLKLSVLKFLGFEQTFKNALTGLPMGGAKGGSNFNPKGKSDLDVMRFCQSLMVELHRYIGEDTDVPAGDIGVAQREISYMFGQYKRMENRFAGVITGKDLTYGGSLVRKEATGYGCVYFMRNMLREAGERMSGKTAAVSGSGNVALYAIEKLAALDAKPITASDSDGFIHDPDGILDEKLEFLIDLKENRRGRVREYAEKFGCDYHPGQKPWGVPCDLAFPCATQNELTEEDAQQLISNGVRAVAEGANMPTMIGAIKRFEEAKILFAPGKAANAGGVAVSGLEQAQNAQRESWSRDEVDQRLRNIMQQIHWKCLNEGRRQDGYINYIDGANLAGFRVVGDAMLSYGAV